MLEFEDITRQIISEGFILETILSIFSDSVCLSNELKVEAMAGSLQKILGYRADNHVGLTFEQLAGLRETPSEFRKSLARGFFAERRMTLQTATGEELSFFCSACYLGLISPVNDRIILRVDKPVQSMEPTQQKLSDARAQVDNFIYRTAHDLRGPLATIQGLLNLIRIRKDDAELGRFISLIESHANTLDERLHKLVFVAQSDEEFLKPEFVVNFVEQENSLRRIVEQNAFVDFLELNFHYPDGDLHGYNEIQLKAILSNLLLHILSLRKLGTNCSIRIFCEPSENALVVGVTFLGFEQDAEFSTNIGADGVYIYTELMKSSRFTFFFAAQKVAMRNNAAISYRALSADLQEICVCLPPPPGRQ